METKHENFIRISTNRVNKIVDLISKLHNFDFHNENGFLSFL